MLTNELEIVVTRVETQHRHLVEPLNDFCITLLLLGYPQVSENENSFTTSATIAVMATLQGLVEEADQLCRIAGYDVLRLGVQSVRQGD